MEKLEKLELALKADTDEKRKGIIEKVQLDIIKEHLSEVNMEYYRSNCHNVSCDLSRVDYRKMRKDENKFIITEDGTIKYIRDLKERLISDSKTFDAIVPVSIEEKDYVLFFVLKGIENRGGYQDNGIKEVGSYIDKIKKNKDDNYYFVLQLDGTYINKYFDKFGVSDKYVVTTSKDINTVVKNFINSKFK